MTLSRSDVADLLRVPAAAYPSFTVSDDVIDLWSAALGGFDAGPVRTVLGRWVAEQDRPPTIHQAIEGTRAEVRRRAEDRAARLLPERDAPNPARARGTFAYLGELLAAAIDGHPVDAGDALGEAYRRGLVAPPLMSRCRCASGWAIVAGEDGTASLAVVPCDRCRGEAYERWADGGFAIRWDGGPR